MVMCMHPMTRACWGVHSQVDHALQWVNELNIAHARGSIDLNSAKPIQQQHKQPHGA